MGALIMLEASMDLEQDPYVKRLRRSPCDGKKLQDVLSKKKTYCREQITRFRKKSEHILEELGGWAVDYFIHESILQLDGTNISDGLEGEEMTYLIGLLAQLPTPNLEDAIEHPADMPIAPKLESLIAFLGHKYSPDTSGLVFVKQRATVAVMAKVLSVHPSTRDLFRCGTYVGWANSDNRKDIVGDLLSMPVQRDTLDDFRSGRTNLVIGTDVLEEGIDISACNLVVCYDKPVNLKSYIQRRGRARQRKSTYTIMFATDDASPDLRRWKELERSMIQAYQDDKRKLQELHELEEEREYVSGRFEIDSTQYVHSTYSFAVRLTDPGQRAVLTPDIAKSHLHHFCSILPQQAHADNRPMFSYEQSKIKGKILLQGTVTLPTCVHPAVRRTHGKRWWRTEDAATKEAAFETYKALYEFGLLTDNLLPLTKKPELGGGADAKIHSLPSTINVAEQYDPWVDWAWSWSSPTIHQCHIAVCLNGIPVPGLEMNLIGPTLLPPLESMTMFWDSKNIFTLSFEEARPVSWITEEYIQHMRGITALYLEAANRRQMKRGKDFVTLFAPVMEHTQLECWLREHAGNYPASEVYSRVNSGSNPVVMGIVRDRSRYDEPLLFKRWLVPNAQDMESMVELECDKFPQRRNFLIRQTLANTQVPSIDDDPEWPPTPSKVRIVAADKCTVDKLPFEKAKFGLFISIIVNRLEAALLATKLRDTILRGVGFKSTEHIITAVTAPTAHVLTDYQRYEFFGDSVLKFTVSCQLFLQHPNWHEGYLSAGRDAIVQNNRLARAALDTGLDAYIIAKMFIPRKWTAPTISECLQPAAGERSMSTKILADIVEALIGAAYLEGGQQMAQKCMHRFMPEISEDPFDNHQVNSTTNGEKSPGGNGTNHSVKKLSAALPRGYFRDESLLVEALTHPSCEYDPNAQSYQRLEFLGDAVLDIIVVKAIWQASPDTPPGNMTQIKHAIVNANLLAFFCMEYAVDEETAHVNQVSTTKSNKNGINFAIQKTSYQTALWRFMRYQGAPLTHSRNLSVNRHAKLRGPILSALESSAKYPWQLLAQLNADKFFSDIFESIVGALFVDTGGDLGVCAEFVEQTGLAAYLLRVLRDGVNVAHPRGVSQQLAGNVSLKFNVERVQSNGPVSNGGEPNGDDATYSCEVVLGNTALFKIEGYSTGEIAEVTAANKAVDILNGMRA